MVVASLPSNTSSDQFFLNLISRGISQIPARVFLDRKRLFHLSLTNQCVFNLRPIDLRGQCMIVVNNNDKYLVYKSCIPVWLWKAAPNNNHYRNTFIYMMPYVLFHCFSYNVKSVHMNFYPNRAHMYITYSFLRCQHYKRNFFEGKNTSTET